MPEVACEDANTIADLADPDHFDTNKPSVLVLCSRIFQLSVQGEIREVHETCAKCCADVVQHARVLTPSRCLGTAFLSDLENNGQSEPTRMVLNARSCSRPNAPSGGVAPPSRSEVSD